MMSRTIRRFKTIGRFVRSQFTTNSVILLYHRVADPGIDPFHLCVSPHHFEQQLAVIRHLGNPVSLPELVIRQQSGNLDPRSVGVSIDDGFLDIKEIALPLLEKYEIPATVYCVPGLLGESFWWDELLSLLRSRNPLPGKLDVNNQVFSTRDLSREDLFRKLYEVILREPDAAQRKVSLKQITSQIEHNDRDDSPPIPRLMNRDELRLLSEHPLITIGAHSVSHQPLAQLSPDEQQHEIETSISALTEITGRPVRTFSYPFGLWNRDFNAITIETIQRAGLNHALAADKGSITRGSDPYRLPRVWVHDKPGTAFARTINMWM